MESNCTLNQLNFVCRCHDEHQKRDQLASNPSQREHLQGFMLFMAELLLNMTVCIPSPLLNMTICIPSPLLNITVCIHSPVLNMTICIPSHLLNITVCIPSPSTTNTQHKKMYSLPSAQHHSMYFLSTTTATFLCHDNMEVCVPSSLLFLSSKENH